MNFWHDQGVLYGVTVKAHFFDAEAVLQETTLPARTLPFLGNAPVKTIFTEEDRQNFLCDELVAQPDAVFEHGQGLIALEYKSVGLQPHSPENWRREIRLKDMLQCLIAGYVVAQNYRKLTACVLRYHNVCYLLTPDPGVIGTMLQLIPMAKEYHREDRRVSATQIAQFSLERIRRTWPGPEDVRADQGRAAHADLLKR